MEKKKGSVLSSLIQKDFLGIWRGPSALEAEKHPNFQKGKKDGPGNHRPVSLTTVAG